METRTGECLVGDRTCAANQKNQTEHTTATGVIHPSDPVPTMASAWRRRAEDVQVLGEVNGETPQNVVTRNMEVEAFAGWWHDGKVVGDQGDSTRPWSHCGGRNENT